MTAPYREDAVLARAPLQAVVIDQLNEVLSVAGLGRPLCPPAGTGQAEEGTVTVLPLVGADPAAVCDALRRAREQGGDLPELVPDLQYAAGTVEDGARRHDGLYAASGKKIGHGTIGWLSAPAYEMCGPVPWRPAGRRSVIALLDTGVESHRWLPEPDAGDAFVVDAPGWVPPVPIPEPGGSGSGSTHHGHGTFLAGLLRLAAPDAQILSIRVMSDLGRVSETNAVAAFTWLAGYVSSGGAVDVVLVAFGRPADAGDGDLAAIEAAIRELSGHGVTIVASAGNHGSDSPVWPAAFATYPGLSVVSVGARASMTGRAPYSNHGVWVREWRDGTNVVSLMPVLTADPTSTTVDQAGYAWWSGTSFAAARYAGELAARPARERPSGSGRQDPP
jgi:hypothetical protein